MEMPKPERAYTGAQPFFAPNQVDRTARYPPAYSPPEEPLPPARNIARTPSPTPSELRALAPPGSKAARAPGERPALSMLIVGVVIAAFVLFEVYHKKIVDAIEPDARKLKHIHEGWLIPVAIFVVISFPPLFGQELLAAIVGIVYGLWIGFAIVCAGTLIGELANYFVFRFACTERAKKVEAKSIPYACLARVVREGGFKIVLIARYSSVPSHLSTTIFSTCGVGFFSFTTAAILSLPKQFALVYAGTVLDQTNPSRKTKIINIVLIVVTTISSIIAYQYILKRTQAVTPEVVYARRKARQAKLEGWSDSSNFNGENVAPQRRNAAVV